MVISPIEKECRTLSGGKETDICSQSVDSGSVDRDFPSMVGKSWNDIATLGFG